MSLAPIVLFVYNRPAHTRKVIEALTQNKLFSKSRLFIYSDGFKNDDDKKEVILVRELIENFDFGTRPEIIKSNHNLGLSSSIINGVTEIFQFYEDAIILEDDILTSPCFLTFMNEALNRYKDDTKVWHISGWNYPVDLNEKENQDDGFFWSVMNCWGWATWSERWKYFKKDPMYLSNNWNKDKIRKFNLNNKFNFWKQIEDNLDGRIDTWAIFWMASIFENSGLCLNPLKSFVTNIGHDNTGENSVISDKFFSEVSHQNISVWPNASNNFDKIINIIADQNFKQEELGLLEYIKSKIKISSLL